MSLNDIAEYIVFAIFSRPSIFGFLGGYFMSMHNKKSWRGQIIGGCGGAILANVFLEPVNSYASPVWSTCMFFLVGAGGFSYIEVAIDATKNGLHKILTAWTDKLAKMFGHKDDE